MNVYIYLVLLISSISSYAGEVKVDHDYRYNFESFYKAFKMHVPKHRIIFVRFDQLSNFIIAENTESGKIFCFFPASLGSVSFKGKEGKLLQENDIKLAISIVAGPHRKADETIENNYNIAEKEISGGLINVSDDTLFIEFRWTTNAYKNRGQKQPKNGTLIKVARDVGGWGAYEISDTNNAPR